MPHAIRLHAHGGPEQFRWEALDVPPPGPGEVRVRHDAIGVNFLDTYHRSGLYKQPLPLVVGSEAAGTIVALGPGVTGWKAGERVAYAGGPPGAYSEERDFPANRLVPVPDAIDAKTAAAVLLKGLTAEYLLRRTWLLKAGDSILVHAAAGGVGLLLCQWGKRLGLRVIGVVGSAEKAEVARHFGADEVVVRTETPVAELAARVKSLNGGQGVHVVYDGVGQDTVLASLDCLRPRGLLVSYGNASGPAPALDPLLLSAKGSLFVTRPTLAHYTATHDELLTAAALFNLVESGGLAVSIHAELPLQKAAEAHRLLESRATTGSVVLVP